MVPHRQASGVCQLQQRVQCCSKLACGTPANPWRAARGHQTRQRGGGKRQNQIHRADRLDLRCSWRRCESTPELYQQAYPGCACMPTSWSVLAAEAASSCWKIRVTAMAAASLVSAAKSAPTNPGVDLAMLWKSKSPESRNRRANTCAQPLQDQCQSKICMERMQEGSTMVNASKD